MGAGKGPRFCLGPRLVIQGHLRPVRLFLIPSGFLPPCLEYLSISTCIYPIHFQNLSHCHYLQRAPHPLFFSSSHCSHPFHGTAKARCVHLINTLVTHSVAAQLLVSEAGAPPAGAIVQGSAGILPSPGLGTAVPPAAVAVQAK